MGLSAASRNAGLCLKPTSSPNTRKANKEMLKTDLEVVNALLRTYATNDLIADTDATLTHYIQLLTMSQSQYAEALVAKWLRFGKVYK